jgi:hypothetical protein
MSDKVFLFAWFCFAGLLGFLGVLMLVGSDGSTRLLFKLLGAARFSKAPLTTRFPWQWRLAGAVLTGLGVYFLFVAISPITIGSPTDENPGGAGSSAITGKWILLAMLVAVFLFGFCLLLSPRTIGQFSRFVMPDHFGPDSKPAVGLSVVRVIGGCFVVAAVWGGLILFRG